MILKIGNIYKGYFSTITVQMPNMLQWGYLYDIIQNMIKIISFKFTMVMPSVVSLSLPFSSSLSFSVKL